MDAKAFELSLEQQFQLQCLQQEHVYSRRLKHEQTICPKMKQLFQLKIAFSML